MANGSIDWMEIPATDLDTATRFYENVFGWKIRRDEKMPEYPMFMDSAEKMGGGFTMNARPASEAGILIYITVENIEKALAKIRDHGGTPQQQKTKISDEIGWWASFKDPSGNLIGLHESART